MACVIAVLCTAPTFGAHPECNAVILVSVFWSFPVLNAGRIFFLTLSSSVAVGYTAYLLHSFYKKKLSTSGPSGGSSNAHGGLPKPNPPSPDPKKERRRFIRTIVLILIFSAALIANTELLRKYNDKAITKADGSWTFGQVNVFNSLILRAS